MSCAWQNLPEETTGKAEGKKDRQGEPRGRMAHTQIGKFATSSRGRRVEGGSGCAANVVSHQHTTCHVPRYMYVHVVTLSAAAAAKCVLDPHQTFFA